MKRLRKSNRVSWAPGFNLSQVKLFLSEDSPSKVGMEHQNHRHANPSSVSHSNNTESNDIPPGFGNNHCVNMKEQLYHIPLVKWKCPPKFIMSSNWQIVAGDESEEVVVQKLREMRVMEAVYPHYSAIPPCPTVSVGTQHEGYDDDLTPVIPIIPIEEEEALEIPLDSSTPDISPVSSLQPALSESFGSKDSSNTIPSTSKPLAKEKPALWMPHALGPDVITAAASAALTAGMKSNEIDTQLLIQILSDPKMIEKLTKECGAATSARTMTTINGVSAAASGLQQASQPISLVGAPASAIKPATKPIKLVKPKPDMAQPIRSVTGKLGHLTNGVQPVFTTSPAQLATRSVSLGSRPANQPATRPGPEHNKVPLPSLGNENIQRTQNQANPMPNMMSGNGMVPNHPLPLPSVKPSNVKDEKYYKNLIRQHGGDGGTVNSGSQTHYPEFTNNQYHNLEMMQKLNSREPKLVNQKPCVYFNSARGCRNGANCVFKHETALLKRVGGITMNVPNGKKMRLGREIMGRT